MTNSDKKVEELFTAGSHLGHKSNKIHPKAKKYIYSMDRGTSIIDLSQTVKLLEEAKDFVTNLSKNNKTLLVVVTKRVASAFVSENCKKNNIPHVTVKWPAGLLTNFDMISKNVKKLKTMREEKETGEWNKFVKHEQIQLQKKLNKLEKFYAGIDSLEKLPDAVFVVDLKKEKNSVKEALEKKLPIIGIVDTNVDPDLITYPIPGNDDASTSIEYFVKEIVDAYSQGKSQDSKGKN
ncbi:30S ribosomal protein S2 [Candidatus Roizmanbacteria bacterium]|nr:30S ribosomal protein S2 [Candidatus Roizmanbacteria bacterium]